MGVAVCMCEEGGGGWRGGGKREGEVGKVEDEKGITQSHVKKRRDVSCT